MSGAGKNPTPGYIIREILTQVHKEHVRGYFITKLFVVIGGLDTMRHPSLECSVTVRSNELDRHTTE